jgi:hypothetical protein
MRTITNSFNVYKFEELTEEQQRRALEKNYYINVEDDYWKEIAEQDLQEDLSQVGITFKHVYFDADRRYWFAYLDKPNIEDSRLFLKSALTAGYKPSLSECKEVLNNGLSIETRHYGCGNGSNYVSAWGEIDALTEYLKTFMEKFLTNAESQYEYVTSEESLRETFTECDYEFTEDGKIYNH